MTELEFQNQVTELAEIYGWSWVHFRPAQTAKGWRTPVSGPLGAGWPDLVLIRERDRRLIFAELKRDGGTLSAQQHDALVTLARLQENDSNYCTCGLVIGKEFAHKTGCRYTRRRRGIEVHVWYPASFDAIAEILQ